MAKIEEKSRFLQVAFTSLIIVTGAVCTRAQAQQSPPSGQDVSATAVEACVESLREKSVGQAHPEVLKPIEDPIGLYSSGMGETGYTEYSVGDEEFSATFTQCINAANPGIASDVTRVSLPWIQGERTVPARYQYTNTYQLHQLRDTENKLVYDLLRIPPPGSIEAKGTWQGGDKPRSEGDPGCVNSRSDPCGTRYFRNRAGGYERL